MKKRFLLLLLPIIINSGCSSKIPLRFVSYTAIEPKETFNKEEGNIYFKEDNVNTLTITPKSGVNIKSGITSFTSLSDVTLAYDNTNKILKSADLTGLNSVKEQHLLVVPAYFTDSSVANDEQLRNDKKVLIENAFFGKSSVTKYESVASFYNKSSYGHLNIVGEVSDWYPITQSALAAKKEAGSTPETYSDKIVKDIVNNFLSEDIINRNSTNNPDKIDALYVIYDYPYEKDKDNKKEALFWAYAYHIKDNAVKASSYAWSSFDFMGDKVMSNHRVNANTYIHETGHLLGLLDYYNNSSIYQPLGMMDMMDYNLGDHSSFSKYLLNWVSPKIIDMKDQEKGEINIRSFTKTGDFILIPKGNFNKTAFDRYLLIEYFTPTGLNDLSNFPNYIYGNKNPDGTGSTHVFTYPNKYGLRVYEVDARLGYYTNNGFRTTEPKAYIDEDVPAGNYDIYLHNNNDLSGNETPLVHLLESSGNNTFKTGLAASNDTLFGLNATFGINTYTDLADEFNISFKVKSLTSSSATISFSKLQ